MRWVIVLLMLSGCAVANGVNAIQSLNAVNRYNELAAKRDWPAALETIRAEIRNPGLKTDDQLVNIRSIGLSALSNTARFRGIGPGFDGEAATYYSEGMAFAKSSPVAQARLNTAYGTYLTNVGKHGQALPYLLKDLDYWLHDGNQYQIIRAYDAIGTVYSDMGEHAAAMRIKQKAQSLAKAYFEIGKRPPPEGNIQWQEYSRMLQQYADNISNDGNMAELTETLKRQEAVSAAYLTPKYLASVFSAKEYAIAGDFYASALAIGVAGGVGSIDVKANRAEAVAVAGEIDCADAQLQHRQHEIAKAKAAEDRCIAYLKPRVPLDSGTLIEAGEIYEEAGLAEQAGSNYEDAIRQLEGLRSSFPIGQRVAFFNSLQSKRSYWGVIRLATRRSAAAGDAAPRFFEAAAASERVRARQFGDLVDPEGGKGGEATALAAFARSLPARSLVIDFTVMEDRIVVLAFSRDTRKSATIAIDRLALERQVARLQDEVSDYTSDLKTVERGLTELSRTVLGPVLPMMRDKSRIIVLADGPLALVPFALWSSDGSRYQPVLTTATVENAPSLRLLQHGTAPREARDRLLALGDPAYPATFSAPGFSQQEIAGMTRRARKSRSGDAIFPPLPETRTEVEAIAKLFAAGNADTMLGSAATKSALLARDLSGYRFLHVATHGVLGGELPGLGEPALVLADDPKGGAFLTASEAQALHLNATLTVLSACNTGNGALYAGEGVIGLGRAFLLAGSKAVLASMWPVELQSTEALMVRFYRLQRGGRPTAEALREAMLSIRQEKPHPAFWAPFILVGE